MIHCDRGLKTNCASFATATHAGAPQRSVGVNLLYPLFQYISIFTNSAQIADFQIVAFIFTNLKLGVVQKLLLDLLIPNLLARMNHYLRFVFPIVQNFRTSGQQVQNHVSVQLSFVIGICCEAWRQSFEVSSSKRWFVM